MKISNPVFFASLGLLALQVTVAMAQEPAPVRAQPRATPDPTLPRATSRTLYSEKTEAFVTFRPAFTVGESVRIGAHLSKLGGERFLPYADARVTATLTVAGAAVSTSVEKPDRPGVFRLALTPTKAGTGVFTVEIAGHDGSDRLTVSDMTVYADRAEGLAKQGPDPEAGAIRYTKEHSWDENEYASAVVAKSAWPGAAAGALVLALPLSAIVEVDGAPCVYVQRHPEAFDLKRVKTGRRNATSVEILEGLQEGQRIVVKGAARMPRK
jgi:multidrug efflux pump subunit AcrA (membrane-fusion protein)